MKTNDEYTESFQGCTPWINIGDGVKWRYVRHWAQNYHAGEEREGRLNKDGRVVDRSGGFNKNTDGHRCVSRPMVFMARKYKKGKREVSAVLSYPNGLSIMGLYFWEIYPASFVSKKDEDKDIKRFTSLKKMENHITRMYVVKK